MYHDYCGQRGEVMKIKITKPLTDLQPYARPRVGELYEVKEVREARFNPARNRGYVIQVGSTDVMVLPDECEVIGRELAR